MAGSEKLASSDSLRQGSQAQRASHSYESVCFIQDGGLVGGRAAESGGSEEQSGRILTWAPTSLFQDGTGKNRLTWRSPGRKESQASKPDFTQIPPLPLSSYVTSDTSLDASKTCLHL